MENETTLNMVRMARPRCPSGIAKKVAVVYTPFAGGVYAKGINEERLKWYDQVDTETGEIKSADDFAIWSRINRLSCQYASTVDETGEKFHYITLEESETSKIKSRLRKRKSRGHLVISCAYPTSDGRTVLVNNQGIGEEMPSSGAGIWDFYATVALTDPNRRFRATGDFGGDYKGSEGFKGDGQKKRQVFSSGSVIAQSRMFANAGLETSLKGFGFVIEGVTIEEVDALLRKSNELVEDFFAKAISEVQNV